MGAFFDMFLGYGFGPPLPMGTFGPLTTGIAAQTAPTTNITASTNTDSSSTNVTQAMTTAKSEKEDQEGGLEGDVN
jgi:hypothetical protein